MCASVQEFNGFLSVNELTCQLSSDNQDFHAPIVGVVQSYIHGSTIRLPRRSRLLRVTRSI